MKTLLKRILAAAVMMVFVTYSIPKEFYHIFTDHADTRHEAHSAGELEITGLHHHCQLLKADQQLTALEFDVFLIPPAAKTDYFASSLAEYTIQPITSLAIAANRLRGPPAA